MRGEEEDSKIEGECLRQRQRESEIRVFVLQCPLLSYTERTCGTYHELGTSGWTARATSRWSMHFW